MRNSSIIKNSIKSGAYIFFSIIMLSNVFALDEAPKAEVPPLTPKQQQLLDTSKAAAIEELYGYTREYNHFESAEAIAELKKAKEAASRIIDQVEHPDNIENAKLDAEKLLAAVKSDEDIEKQRINDALRKLADDAKTSLVFYQELEKKLSFTTLVLYITGILLLLLIGWTVFIIIFYKKKTHLRSEKYLKDFEALKQSIDNVINSAKNNLSSVHNQETNIISNNVLSQVQNLEAKLNSLALRLEKKEAGGNNVDSSIIQNIQNKDRPIEWGSDVLSNFNKWALNPNSMLAPGMYYVSGELKVRSAQDFTKSERETMWITNEAGKKYLFPNPLFFDLTTNISQFYKMDAAKLKRRGMNQIKVIKPCEIEENGVINYAGELQLL
ncbi:MAG: hypothetical protein Ta2F_17310 [Termitinemataceae bacterium]|nr:MAG: hypothetical protein Ta2F_17310 [Termitinemataceae bacterium]